MNVPQMQLSDINGLELEVYDQGSGEPVVFVHAMREEWYGVLAEPALADNYRLVYYHRRGYGRSTRTGIPLSLPQQAEDCRAVMRHLGIERAHMAGLSGGGLILLYFAREFPDAVHSLALLEPALVNILEDDAEFQQLMARVGPLIEAGDVSAAVDMFFQGVVGPDYAELFDRTVAPGWWDRMIGDMDAGLADMAAVNAGQFTAEDAARIKAPVLNMMGGDSRPMYRKIHQTVNAWMPHAESVVLPDTTHAMPQTNPKGTAKRLAEFFSRHPL